MIFLALKQRKNSFESCIIFEVVIFTDKHQKQTILIQMFGLNLFYLYSSKFHQ